MNSFVVTVSTFNIYELFIFNLVFRMHVTYQYIRRNN